MAVKVKVTDENASGGFEKVLFTGITPVKVLAVNPTKEELEKIYGRELEKETEYVSADENNVKKIRIDFIVQVFKSEKLGVTVDTIEKIPFFLEDRVVVGSESGKYEIINKYGESGWASKDEFIAKKMTNENYIYKFDGARQAFVGECALVKFLRAFLGIDEPRHWNKDQKAFTYSSKLDDAEIVLDEIKKYFTGDVKEIKNLIKLAPNNIVKIPAGVKTTDDNKQYMSWFTDEPILYSSSYYKTAIKQITERKKMLNVDFGPEDMKFRLYNNTPTDIQGSQVGAPTTPAPDAGFWAD